MLLFIYREIDNMKINRVSLVSFKGKIIDAHAHVGTWQGKFYNAESIDSFVKNPLANGDEIEKILVSNLSCIDSHDMKSEIEGNLEMLDIAKKNSKIAPLAVCQPKTGNVSNIQKLIRENPNMFIGLKFHPDCHEIMASDELLNPYLSFAQKEKLPCVFHCGIPSENGDLISYDKRYSSPQNVYSAAKKIPDTPVIMAHMGAGDVKVQYMARDILLESIEKGDANLYADISWVDVNNPEKTTIIGVIQKLKNHPKGDMTSRLLFGSDVPIGEFDTGKDGLSGKQFYEKVVIDVKNAIKKNFKEDADDLIDKIFYKNAKQLFGINNSFKDESIITESIPNSNLKTKKVLIVTLGLAVLASAYAIFSNKKDNKELK